MSSLDRSRSVILSYTLSRRFGTPPRRGDAAHGAGGSCERIWRSTASRRLQFVPRLSSSQYESKRDANAQTRPRASRSRCLQCEGRRRRRPRIAARVSDYLRIAMGAGWTPRQEISLEVSPGSQAGFAAKFRTARAAQRAVRRRH